MFWSQIKLLFLKNLRPIEQPSFFMINGPLTEINHICPIPMTYGLEELIPYFDRLKVNIEMDWPVGLVAIEQDQKQ
ncbi:hypothetical protein [Membranihabitans marinus]|uniref:hypothetical protein n=1 Tax=Membranihabitans marinus TaxID=1227546 RepID=UPI001F1C11C7|nr:hypothetical protein [Membranihabitans marinus]